MLCASSNTGEFFCHFTVTVKLPGNNRVMVRVTFRFRVRVGMAYQSTGTCRITGTGRMPIQVARTVYTALINYNIFKKWCYYSFTVFTVIWFFGLQCFDAVGCVAQRASACKKNWGNTTDEYKTMRIQ